MSTAPRLTPWDLTLTLTLKAPPSFRVNVYQPRVSLCCILCAPRVPAVAVKGSTDSFVAHIVNPFCPQIPHAPLRDDVPTFLPRS